VARVRAAQAAVADIQGAMAQEDHQELGAALRAFEGLCRPGGVTSWCLTVETTVLTGWAT
jgi:hypothetical protein